MDNFSCSSCRGFTSYRVGRKAFTRLIRTVRRTLLVFSSRNHFRATCHKAVRGVHRADFIIQSLFKTPSLFLWYKRQGRLRNCHHVIITWQPPPHLFAYCIHIDRYYILYHHSLYLKRSSLHSVGCRCWGIVDQLVGQDRRIWLVSAS